MDVKWNRIHPIEINDVQCAISILNSECFVSMLYANAFGGMPSEKWALIHAGFEIDDLNKLVAKLE